LTARGRFQELSSRLVVFEEALSFPETVLASYLFHHFAFGRSYSSTVFATVSLGSGEPTQLFDSSSRQLDFTLHIINFETSQSLWTTSEAS